MDASVVMLVAASTAFVGTHFLLSHPLRAPLVGALENGALPGSIRWSPSPRWAG
jgi:hypothetical protein